MFGKKEQKTTSTVTTARPAVTPRRGNDTTVTILTTGCNFIGKLYCQGSTRIAGEIEGEVISEGLLVVEQTALIKGDITADEVVVHGRVEGTIHSKGRVSLAPNCLIDGDVHSKSLVMAEGAALNGAVHMNSGDSTPTDSVKEFKAERKVQLSQPVQKPNSKPTSIPKPA
jgi:cytoskeletal protein CcmA (bactofilin family)